MYGMIRVPWQKVSAERLRSNGTTQGQRLGTSTTTLVVQP